MTDLGEDREDLVDREKGEALIEYEKRDAQRVAVWKNRASGRQSLPTLDLSLADGPALG